MYTFVTQILAILGFVYVITLLNKVLHHLLPRITVDNGNFFDKKLGIRQVNSLLGYIILRVQVILRLRQLRNVSDKDICQYDIDGFTEVRNFLKNIIVSRSMTVCCCKRFKLQHGKLSIHLLEPETLLNKSVVVRFESDSADRPIVTMCLDLEKNSFYQSLIFRQTVKKWFRLTNPEVALFNDIRDLVHMLGTYAVCSRSTELTAKIA